MNTSHHTLTKTISLTGRGGRFSKPLDAETENQLATISQEIAEAVSRLAELREARAAAIASALDAGYSLRRVGEAAGVSHTVAQTEALKAAG